MCEGPSINHPTMDLYKITNYNKKMQDPMNNFLHDSHVPCNLK